MLVGFSRTIIRAPFALVGGAFSYRVRARQGGATVTRRAIFSLAFLLPPVAVPEEFDAETAEEVNFNEYWGVYFRAKMGCPQRARDYEECTPSAGNVDYASKIKARKSAMKVFDLKEKD